EEICSSETIGKLKSMLEGVVELGNGRTFIRNPLYKIAGKTGTAQVADGSRGYRVRKYQSSFCGYFPADKPKYAMIVVINDPKDGYYAATIAGPVFKEVADKIYANDVDMYNHVEPFKMVGNTKMPSSKAGYKKTTQKVNKALGVKALFAANREFVNEVDTNYGVAIQEVKVDPRVVPDVAGMGLKDAVYLLSSTGLKPLVRGSGKVINQSIRPGSTLVKGHPITIELE
ncbi:MAG: PASTA domain-containing protein, partial [Pyrinomonadaceae bacterium]|nr:PASTA domain-containing protein [Sphingobacteriaceae bacterium]